MRNNLVKCSNCDLNFLSREGMEKHFKRVHFPKETGSASVSMPRTRFKCENCDEEFNTKLDFKKHRDPQKLLCKKCQEDKKKFICDNKCELIKHVRKMHQRDLMLKKQNILEQKKQEKLQKRQQQLQQQQTMVKNFTPRHQCLKCLKVFKDNNFLELHMKEEHSNNEIKKEMVEIKGNARRLGTTKITPIAPKTRSMTPARAAVVTKQEPPPVKKQRTIAKLPGPRGACGSARASAALLLQDLHRGGAHRARYLHRALSQHLRPPAPSGDNHWGPRHSRGEPENSN